MIIISKQQKGFTLVELIVVIVILGILSAVAAPKFFEVDTYKERAFKDDLVNALRYAQKRAVASGKTVKVVIDTNGFALLYGDGTVVPGLSGETQYKTNAEYGVPSSVSINAGDIIFDALGRAESNSYAIESGGSYTDVGLDGISVWPETGCVEPQ